MSAKKKEARTREAHTHLAYELPEDLVEMTDEQIDAFAAQVVADARKVLRPQRKKER